MVFIQAVLMIAAGALVIANVRFGGLLMSAAMLTMIATRDNPLLSVGEFAWKHNMQNTLKDLAVAGIGIVIYMRKLQIRHRKERKRD